ncbi:MAG: hypothetical protein Q8T09_01925 [Candidatus Melainabacteria bacterium]|nr:hypothetical protein [Candidatus Melainabacteria bacterium]
MTREATRSTETTRVLDTTQRSTAPDAAPLHGEAIQALSSPPSEVRVGRSDAPSPTPVKAEVTEKGSLTSEMKAAVDKSEKIVVKMAPAGGDKDDKSDLVIKADGTIVQNLNMDPKKAESQHLTVSVEQNIGSSETLTKQQQDALEKVLAYAKGKNKEVTLAESASSTPPEAKEGKATPVPNAAQPSAGDSGGGGGGGGGGGSAPSGDAAMPGGADGGAYGAASDSGAGYSGDGGYSSPSPPDYSKVDLSALVTEWFNDPASLEKFKKLYPELYARLLGPDGKLDMNKLNKMKASNDPVLEGLRDKLPTIASEFPNTKALSSVPSASGDAVNPTGAKIAESALQVAAELPGSGYCAKGVSYAIERATGKVIGGNANDMRESLPSHGFKETPFKDLKVGQVVHAYWTPEVYAQEQAKRGPCPNYGDIFVVGKDKNGQLLAINDAIVPLDQKLSHDRYAWGGAKAFTPTSIA